MISNKIYKCPDPGCKSKNTRKVENEKINITYVCDACGIFFTPGKKVEKMMWETNK